MGRKLEDWLSAWLRFNENTESPHLFHKWTGISMIAAALRRKVWFNFGRIKIYPNLFIVFVAEPGMARKTQALSFGEEILHEIPSVYISADCITPEAILQDLETAAINDEEMPDGTKLTHNSISIISGEFETFLGSKKDNTKMLVLLTNLYDCKPRPFEYRTKTSGSNRIEAVYLNLIAATTPESLANSFPSSAIGGGLTSRIIFIWEEKKSKKVPIPDLPPGFEQLKSQIMIDLLIISRIAGGYDFNEESKQFWINWYNEYEEKDPHRICQDPAFIGWYSRKPMFVLKLATILSASFKNERIVETPELEKALDLLNEVEHRMAYTFSAVGRSEITSDVDVAMKIIREYGSISEKELIQRTWRDIDFRKFGNVMDTILHGGYADVKRVGKDRIFSWTGKK